MGRAGVELRSSAVLALAVLSPGHVCVQWERLRHQAVQESLCGKADLQGSSPRKDVQSETTERTPETLTTAYGEKKWSSEDIPVFTQPCQERKEITKEHCHGRFTVGPPLPQVTESALHHCRCYPVNKEHPYSQTAVSSTGIRTQPTRLFIMRICTAPAARQLCPESWAYKDGRDLKSPEALGEGTGMRSSAAGSSQMDGGENNTADVQSGSQVSSESSIQHIHKTWEAKHWKLPQSF